jgi:hypothetical protein
MGFAQPRLKTYPEENFRSLGDFGSFRIGLSVRPAGLDRVNGPGPRGLADRPAAWYRLPR